MTDFTDIEQEIEPHHTGTRTRSAALLAWFLEAVWRLDPEEVPDFICDGPGDKGIDALVVDEDLGEISIFQSKHRDSHHVTQGDLDLRSLVGAAASLESVEAYDALIAARPNAQLLQLLQRQEIRDRIEDGAHATKLVFVTNALLDAAGRSYVETVADREPRLVVWDRTLLATVAGRTRRPDMRAERLQLHPDPAPTVWSPGPELTLAVGLVPAAELVNLPGIEDLSLFARNVRLGLGRSRVNRELGETLENDQEHALFPAYHNGLTILTNGLTASDGALDLDGLSVVNGCQSLLSLHQHRNTLDVDMRVLVKIVQVPAHSDIADKITYRTNNQNPVDIRDQRSTDPVQRALQADVRDTFGTAFEYGIREGETLTADRRLDNKNAAQLIMAVYLGEPWNAVRKVRLFDHDYRRIFNHEIDASKLLILSLIDEAIVHHRTSLQPNLAASFAAVRLTIAHLLAEVLRESELGAELLSGPLRWLPEQSDEVLAALTELAGDVVASVNFHVDGRLEDEGDAYDPKTVLKSAAGVRPLKIDVLTHSRRQVRRDPTYAFSVEPHR